MYKGILFFLLALIMCNTALAAIPERIFVADSSLREIIEANPITGDRVFISGDAKGSGPIFQVPSRLGVSLENELIVIDTGLNAVFKVEIATGNRAIVFNNSVGVVHDGAFDSAGSLILTHSGTNTVSKINISTGQYIILSDAETGTGPLFTRIEGVAVDNSGNIYVSDSGLATIFKVDISTGDRTIFDEGLTGTSPFYGSPRELVLDKSNNSLIINDVTGIIPITLIRIGLATKARSIISSRRISGPTVDYYRQIGISSNRNIIAVGNQPSSVIEVNHQTGTRNVISSNTIGSGILYSDIGGVALISLDDDNDGILDTADNCPLDANQDQLNADGDSFGDTCDADDDNDGILDSVDNCIIIANALQEDADNDGIGNACDPDDDNDNLPDLADNCPLASNPSQTDADSDGIGDSCDSQICGNNAQEQPEQCDDGNLLSGDGCSSNCFSEDSDNDGVLDAADNCAFISNPYQENNDGDSFGDVCDFDDDNDGVPDLTDNCQIIANPGQLDTDADNFGNACDTDDDNDGTFDGADNCIILYNPLQEDNDLDNLGNECDNDDDNDEVPDASDNCILASNQGQADNDIDGAGNECDPDDDNDNVPDAADNCQYAQNSDQADNELDGIGDLCDLDDDNDGVHDSTDNCPLASNPSQTDADSDQIGASCDFGLASTDFIRGSGAPSAESVIFESYKPSAMLKIYNGGLMDNTNEFVSSSKIYLNGQLLIGNSNFNQQIDIILQQVSLHPVNILNITIYGKPGGRITIAVED